MHIQPQRHLRTGALGGAEALLRWDSARLGRMVPPAEILAAAGEAGLTRALDRWVLRGAMALQREWLGEAGLPQRLGVNISAATLQDLGFAEEVTAALDHAGLPPSALEIEIPEDLAPCATCRRWRRRWPRCARRGWCWRWMISALAIPAWPMW